ncbi:hypothetical protein N7E02_03145 (plasmid) [Aliirhizobium terrae]|uniref:hypothetical protein n=1 Tax=Terrirhizobium terrae TaxID=2926709 RepID=UPI0025787E99|nr:hypothetical protein [Rhizobium sp. CC-CFT758]WJH37802.1 hypothetical protein N7E02_03145 [Rhizobium sp. CC-CFT758]
MADQVLDVADIVVIKFFPVDDRNRLRHIENAPGAACGKKNNGLKRGLVFGNDRLGLILRGGGKDESGGRCQQGSMQHPRRTARA